MKNAVAEAATRTVKGSASALLPELLRLAVKYLEFSHSINTMSKTPLESRSHVMKPPMVTHTKGT